MIFSTDSLQKCGQKNELLVYVLPYVKDSQN